MSRKYCKNSYTKESLDVTLACGDEQMKAHKSIYLISLLNICPFLRIFGDFLSLSFDFLSIYALFLELFSPSLGLIYIPLYLFFLYFCIATI